MPETLIWVDADGGEHDLIPDYSCIPNGVQGRMMPPLVLTFDEPPGTDGGLFRQARFGVRRVTVPTIITAATAAGLRPALRTFLESLDPRAGVAGMLVANLDGVERETDAFYEQGFEGDETFVAQTGGPSRGAGAQPLWYQRAVVTFACMDPLWRDRADSVGSIASDTPDVFFPILPMTLGDDSFGTGTITNLSALEAWPVWTITGPFENLVLTNTTSGRSFSWTGTRGTGESLIVDTRPGFKTVKDETGANRFDGIGGGRDLWPLEPGVNAVTVGMDTYTDGVTAVDVAWRHRYLSA